MCEPHEPRGLGVLGGDADGSVPWHLERRGSGR